MDEHRSEHVCALCGVRDSAHAWPPPPLPGMSWQCPRCEAVRFLWQDLAAERQISVV